MTSTTIRSAAIHADKTENSDADLPARTQKLLKPKAKISQMSPGGGPKQPIAQPTRAAKTDTLPEGLEDNTNGVQRLPKLPRAPRKPKEPKICGCGCGNATRGGRFIPGHDARLHGWALRVTRGIVKLEDIEHEGERAAVKAHLKAAEK